MAPGSRVDLYQDTEKQALLENFYTQRKDRTMTCQPWKQSTMSLDLRFGNPRNIYGHTGPKTDEDNGELVDSTLPGWLTSSLSSVPGIPESTNQWANTCKAHTRSTE